jgi:hypothetical protein
MISFENQGSLIPGYDFGLLTIAVTNAGDVRLFDAQLWTDLL